MKSDHISVSEIATLTNCELPHVLMTALIAAGMHPRRHASRGHLIIDREDWQKHSQKFWKLLPSESPGAA